MGRKIPGKKHRGVKDPLLQSYRRFERIANKVDRNPVCPDEQEVPKKALEVMNWKKKAKNPEHTLSDISLIDEKLKATKNSKRKRKLKRRLKEAEEIVGEKKVAGEEDTQKKSKKLLSNAPFLTKDTEVEGASKPVKIPEIVTQRTGENEKHFVRRLAESCQTLLREAYYEEQYKVRVVRNSRGQVATVVNDNFDKELMAAAKIKLSKQERRKKRKKESVLSKDEKRRAKVIAKLEMIKTGKEFSDLKDEVQFGEVVHRPPMITAHPKMKTNSQAERPGRKNLLLKTVLDHSAVKKSKTESEPALSLAKKEMLEAERERIVKLYREMKSKASL